MSYVLRRTTSRNILMVFLAIVLALSLLLPVQSHAATFNDISTNWAKEYIERASAMGLIQGYPDGSFKPNQPVTRAEFTSMLNRTLGNMGMGNNIFSDISPAKWYYSDVLKAVRAAYVAGFPDSTFRPEQNISRQEAAAMLARIIPTYGYSGTLAAYTDAPQIGSWAVQSMSRMNGKGYLTGFPDGKMRPLDSITRGQVAKIITSIVENERIVKSDPMVRTNKTNLSGTIYSNDVTIAKELGEGDASIENSVILGTLNVLGGGTNSITVLNSRVVNAIVNKANSEVSLVARGESCLNDISAYKLFKLQTAGLSGGEFGAGFVRVHQMANSTGTLAGSFPYVSQEGSGAKMTLSSGTIDQLEVTSAAKKSEVNTDSGAMIRSATVDAEAYFRGSGTINSMQVNASGVTYETKPRSLAVAPGVKQPTQTSPSMTVTVTPADGAKNVDTQTAIIVKFGAAITYKDGTSVDATDIQNTVKIRRGSATGALVAYTGTISSDQKSLTLTPTSPLAANTRYYVVVNADMVRDADKNYNKGSVTWFDTGIASVVVTYNPKNNLSNVPTNTRTLAISFSEPLKKNDGKAIDDAYLKDSVVTFIQKSGLKAAAPVPKDQYNVTIDGTRKVITITTKADLEKKTKYTYGLMANRLRTDKGNYIPASSATFDTVSVAGLNGISFVKRTETEIQVSITPNTTGDIHAIILPATYTGTPTPAQIKDNTIPETIKTVKVPGAVAGTAQALTFDGLTVDTAYKIYAVLYIGDAPSQVASLTGQGATTALLLDSLVTAPTNIAGFAPTNLSYTVYVPKGTAHLGITAGVDGYPVGDATGVVKVDGDNAPNKNQVDVPLGTIAKTIPVSVVGKAGVTTTYLISVQFADPGLNKLTIESTVYVPGTSPDYEVDATATTIRMTVDAVESDATIVGSDGTMFVDNQKTFATIGAATPGDTTVYTITITSKDGMTSANYIVKFKRT